LEIKIRFGPQNAQSGFVPQSQMATLSTDKRAILRSQNPYCAYEEEKEDKKEASANHK
jgi:hypothetical protein